MKINDIFVILAFSMIFLNNINDLFIYKIYKQGIKNIKPEGKYMNYIMMVVMMSSQWSIMMHIPIYIFSIINNIDLYEPFYSLLIAGFGKMLFSLSIDDDLANIQISEYVYLHIVSIVVIVSVFIFCNANVLL